MNKRKLLIPTIGTMFLTLTLLMSFTPSFAAVTIGPKLEVVTIPEYDQVRNTGVVVLGLTHSGGWALPSLPGSNFVASYKIIVTYNGLPVIWDALNPQNGIQVACAVLQKVPVNPPDPPGANVKQFPEELLKTTLVDQSSNFVCKLRWVVPASGLLQSTGVLDVYYIGPATAGFIGDNILTVEAFIKIGTTYVFGADIQDVCVLGWSMGTHHLSITLPDTNTYDTWDNPLGPFSSCGAASLAQRDDQGITIASA